MKSDGFDSGPVRPMLSMVPVSVENDALAHQAMLGAPLRRIGRLDVERPRKLN
jgi:hypothetical protein